MSAKAIEPSPEFPIEQSREVLECLKKGKIYSLRPGDVLVVNVDRKIYTQNLLNNVLKLANRLFPKNRAIITVDGVRIKVLRKVKKAKR